MTYKLFSSSHACLFLGYNIFYNVPTFIHSTPETMELFGAVCFSAGKPLKGMQGEYNKCSSISVVIVLLFRNHLGGNNKDEEEREREGGRESNSAAVLLISY